MATIGFDHTTSPALNAVLDEIPSPVFIKDRDGRFQSVNRAYEDFLGVPRASLLGRTVREVYPADLADRYEAADSALYAAGGRQVYEVPLEVPGGERRPTLVSKSILRDARGETLGLIGTFSDLSDLRRAEHALTDANDLLEARIAERTRELARANALLTASLESTADGILVIDGARNVVAYNARFLAMWHIDPAVARTGQDASLLSSVIDSVRDPKAFVQQVEAIYANPDEQVNDEVELADGRRFDRYSLPMRVADEAPGRVWSFRDVTRERQLELEMRHSQKMEAVGRLAGGVAHDFNNLLTIMLASLDFVTETLSPDHPAMQDLNEIQGAALRAVDLTRQLLTFSRKQVVAARVVDLNRTLRDMTRMMARLLGETVTIELRCDPALGLIRIDPSQIEQVIANLSVNARDAMPCGGSLVMSTRNVSGSTLPRGAGPLGGVELAITDTGVGMSEDLQTRIFEPFFTTKERGKGTGLGLSTVFGIVTQAGGQIDVESAPGRGSTFRIVFPRVDEALADASVRPAPPPPPASATVLLVEDEGPLRRAVARQLCRAGYVVVEAEHSAEAEALAARHQRPFDLLITDVVMPQKSGVELARGLSEQGLVRRVLFISGYTGEADGMPADAKILPKPFQTDGLLRKVTEALTDG